MKDSPKRVKAPCSDHQSEGSRKRVVLLGTAALSGRYDSSKAKYGWETDSGQVLWRKDEKDFEKRVKRSEIVEKEAVKTDRGYDGATRPKVAEWLPKALDKMKPAGLKKVQAVKGLVCLRDYGDFV
jgi:hypothetical protein